MAHPEAQVSIEHTVSLVERYREFYEEQPTTELTRVPLVAHHDPTIYFTNSTTSVMKQYLRGEDHLRHSVYLTQPAMGSQGIQAWQRERRLGPYSSSFLSLGSLYRGDLGGEASQDMTNITSEAWGLESDRLHFVVDERDTDILATLDAYGLKTTVHATSDGLFRHSYGIEGVGGRNANLTYKNKDGTENLLGNLTLIESTRDTNPRFWEVSFDSTPVLATLHKLSHAILTLTASDIVHSHVPESTESLVAADAATVTALLLLEGMEPRSRGKSGLLRKFFKEYVTLVSDEIESPTEITDIITEVASSELTIRKCLSPEASESTNIEVATMIASEWVPQFLASKEKVTK